MYSICQERIINREYPIKAQQPLDVEGQGKISADSTLLAKSHFC